MSLLTESRAWTRIQNEDGFAETCQVFGGCSNAALLRLSFLLGGRLGHGDPLPASPKCDMKSWNANLKSGVGFGGSVCEVGMNIERRSLRYFTPKRKSPR